MQRHRMRKDVGKIVPIDSLNVELPQTFNFVKTNKKPMKYLKCNKMRYACSLILCINIITFPRKLD